MNRSHCNFSWILSCLLLLGLVTCSSAAPAQSADPETVRLFLSDGGSPAESDPDLSEQNSQGWALPAEWAPSGSAFDESVSSSRTTAQQHSQLPTNEFIAIQPRPVYEQKIQWEALMTDSTRFLLFQHAFRLATEGDTRAGLSGPFFRDYKDSVLNIHGWNDGDPFFVNYIDHPMEGSVAGFLEIAHDPRYRRAEIGASSEYWKSRFRAMAFSAAFSLQFEIGPLSEASIGNIQTDPKKRGVADWVITPVVGMGWMVGEDAIDKYIVRRFESRTDSHLKRILLRGILNPSRSFANMIQGKVPWHRDTRPGVSEF